MVRTRSVLLAMFPRNPFYVARAALKVRSLGEGKSLEGEGVIGGKVPGYVWLTIPA